MTLLLDVACDSDRPCANVDDDYDDDDYDDKYYCDILLCRAAVFP
jgi:hypothetical protein